MTRIAVVSNRLPPLDREEATAGGLAVGLNAALESAGGTWLGWDGTVTATPEDQPRTQRSEPYAVLSLPLSEDEHAGYYVGFANRTLWPLLHGRTDLLRFDPSEFATYRAVNARFARALAANIENHDLIWIHDYHFLFLGRELRRLGTGIPTGFFLHVPFPAPETLAALPCHREIIEALCAYDLVGFQTENDVHNFREFISRHFGGSVTGDGTVFAMGRRFRTGAFPIGIDTRRFAELAASKEVSVLRGRLRECFRDCSAIIGVDRLDYTKGLPNRLQAFERMLDAAPADQRKAVLLQIAAPSRETVPEYGELREELETLSGRINACHGGIDWTPVRYINRAFSQTRLAALYRHSRVGLVTPLRDGMNLVAKEYVAAQSAEDPGVLVLSRFAGAAERLTGALLVNPHDVDAMARAMREALRMSLFERRERWSEMMTELRSHDVHGWRDEFLRTLLATRRWHDPKGEENQAAVVPFAKQAGGRSRQGIVDGVPEPASPRAIPRQIRPDRSAGATQSQSGAI